MNLGNQFQTDIRTRHPGYKFKDDSKIGIRGVKLDRLKADTEADNHDIVGIATNDTVDTSNEVVLAEGADLTYINSYKNLYSDHYYGMSFIIGKLRYLRPYAGKGAKGWEFRAALFRGMSQQLAEDCMIIVQEGGDIGASIGFDAMEWDRPSTKELDLYPGAELIIRRWKWIELSLTAMPCNMTCAADLAPSEMDAKRFTFLDELVTKGRIKRESAAAFGLKDAVRKTCLVSFARPKAIVFQRPQAR